MLTEISQQDGTTQPSDAQGTFNLVDGALLPISGNKVTDVNVAVGSELAFVFSGASVPAPHSIYCGVVRISLLYNFLRS